MYSVGSLPSRYDSFSIEKRVKRFWKENRIYEKIRRMKADKPKFYFLDGPPYPSSDLIHVGTAWNKTIKDAVIRFRRMQGYNVRDQPGYDCHGLPIEVAVEKMLGFKSKRDIEKYGIDRFIEKCRELVYRNVKAMTQQFADLGVSMDWDNPYMTLKKEYIESAWWLFKKAYMTGLLEKGVKVMHWCPRCETVLADIEVSEYKMLEDPSIFVKFPVRGRDKEYIVIWTTTPWTLPANVAVMVHPDYDYARVKVGDEVLIMALARVKPVLDQLGVKYEVLEVFKGEKLEGLRYDPPLLEEVTVQRKLLNENAHVVVLSREYVHLEEGTGCVHTAPGHGEEDFEVSKIYNLPVVSPVDNNGCFTEDAGKYAGMYVRDANPVIVEDLRRKGLLLYATTIVHKYPVCWRCKTPLIFRATEQWFIKLTKIKDKLLKEAEKINWIPKWAGTHRFKNWLLGLKDWVVTRQRYWGIPVPIWICEKCGSIEVIGSLDELKERSGLKEDIADLHKPWIDKITFKCRECGGTMRRIPDVTDVWYDSGVSFFASLGFPKNMEEFKKWWPVDFIVEGHDQISGWFDKLFKAGIVGFGEPPFKNVLMHGFALDEKGMEMHKSLGNFVSGPEAISRYGRDPLRLYVLSNIVWEDLRFSWDKIKMVLADLNVMWNVYVFASTYMSLDKYTPVRYDEVEVKARLKPEDRWILSRLQKLVKEVTESMEKYLVHQAARSIRRFIVEDLSHWYIKLVRRRVWIEEEEWDKITAYYTLYKVLKTLLALSAPFVPFITEEIYQRMFRSAEPNSPESVHMLDWPKFEAELVDEELERNMKIAMEIVESGLAARNKAKIKIRQPLRELIVVSDEPTVAAAVRALGHVISDVVNVKSVRVEPRSELEKYFLVKVEPVMSRLGPAFRGKAAVVAEAIRNLSQEDVSRLLGEGALEVEVEGEKVAVEKDYVKVVKEVKEEWSLEEFSYGVVVLNTVISARERAEGLARDIVRRIQYMRKEMDLPVDAYISVKIAIGPEEMKLLKEFNDYIMYETRAKELDYVDKLEVDEEYYVKKWRIEDIEADIAVKKL